VALVADLEQPSDEVISVRGLTKVYPGGGDTGADLVAVDNLELTVNRGEIFGLLGPNGAGKTTTVGMLTTRVIPTAGSALVNGIDVVADPARAKLDLGVVPQANTLDRSLTVWENLYFHGRYFGMSGTEATDAADELLERFRLTAKANAEVYHLSGGMAQRLMVARAILHRPAVLFLDEPTAGLDPQSRLALWEIVGRLNEEGQTILLTTHYMEEADRICHRVAIMDHGRILALDTPAQLKRAGAGNEGMRGKVKVLLSRSLESVPPPERLSVQGPTEDLPDTQRIRDDANDVAELLGFDFEGLHSDEVTLETVFINLTGRDLRE
jgi:ABC-2 type transport system ATP-binding protein